MNHHVVSYAQNREDLILHAFFLDQKKGFYVDVGANDPAHESVTKFFYDKGWSGINIEPIPSMYQKLLAERPRDINLGIGVGSKKGKATLHYYPHGDGLSTLSEKMASGYKAKPIDFTKGEKEFTVDVLTLKQILGEYAKNTPISFMKIDVEGLEYEVIIGNDWDKFRPQVICIESNHIEKDWHPYLKKQGYSLAFYDGLNEYFTDNKTDRAKKFNYVDAVIFNEPIVNFRLLKDFDAYDQLVQRLTSANVKLEADLSVAQNNIRRLQNELNEVTPLKRHAKRQVKRHLQNVDQKILRKLSREHNAVEPTSVPDALPDNLQELLNIAKDNDKKNFRTYNQPAKHHPLLPVYKTSRIALKKTAKVINKKKRP